MTHKVNRFVLLPACFLLLRETPSVQRGLAIRASEYLRSRSNRETNLGSYSCGFLHGFPFQPRIDHPIYSCSLFNRTLSGCETKAPMKQNLSPCSPTPVRHSVRMFLWLCLLSDTTSGAAARRNPQWDDALLKRAVGGFRDYSCGLLEMSPRSPRTRYFLSV